jgi:nitroreductase
LGSKKAEAESICVNLFRKALRLASPLVPQLKRMAINDAFFFKDAPEVIIISSKSPINAGLASAYMEIEANSLGLGILYSGFFVACSRLSRKLRRLLDLPRGHSVQTCMVIGYPAVKYQRIAPRKPAHVRTL